MLFIKSEFDNPYINSNRNIILKMNEINFIKTLTCFDSTSIVIKETISKEFVEFFKL